MQLSRPFRVITPTVDGDVLAALASADAQLTAPGVHRLIGRHSEAGVRKALHRLAGQGIVHSERAGRADLYRLNRDHLAAGPIIELAGLFESYLRQLRSRVEVWEVAPELVMLFGSAARGEMDAGSDIDLFVVGDDDRMADDGWREQIIDLVEASAAWTGNDTRVLEYRSSELRLGSDPVLDSIRRDGVHIAGDPRLLRPIR